MAPVYRNQWQTLLRVDQGIDQGPQSISEEAFEKNCLRCGRTLNPSGSGHHTWRWTGFNMGLDIIVTYENFKLSIKRNLASTSASEHEALLDTHKKRRIYYKISYACLNEQKQVGLMRLIIHKPVISVRPLFLPDPVPRHDRFEIQVLGQIRDGKSPENSFRPCYLSFTFVLQLSGDLTPLGLLRSIG